MFMGLEILLLVGVAVAIMWAVREGWTPGRLGQRREQNSALDILEGRFARGEIDREEFLERRAFLESEGSESRPA